MADDVKRRRGYQFKDLSGQVFSRLTVRCWAGKAGRANRWLCDCECGETRLVTTALLNNGSSLSCGCLRRERFSTIMGHNRTHGHASRSNGNAGSATYVVWLSMRARCRRPKNKAFHRYGGRGISVCERWLSFDNFFADMGERPPGLSLERKNNDGNYEPGNCVWATNVEQANNRSSNLCISFEDRAMTVTQWARELGIAKTTLVGRFRNGWSVERALTEPVWPTRAER
jgi:hypothetical protein